MAVRRWSLVRRWAGRGVLVLVGLPAVLLGLALAALQTGPGRDLAATLAESAVPGLEIGRLEGPLPFEARVAEVTLSDSRGAWLSLDRGRLAWDVWALFQGTLAVEALELGRLEIARAPQATVPVGLESGDADREPDGEAGLPTLPPVGLRLDNLAVAHLRLGPDLLGEPLDLSVEGRFAAGDATRIDSELQVLLFEEEGELSARATFFPQSNRLEAEITASAPGGGLATRLLALPGEPPLALRLQGAGPLAAWQGEWSAQVGEVAEAAGLLTLEGRDPLGFRLSGQAQVAALLPPELQALAEPQVDFALSGHYGEAAGLFVDRLGSGAARLTGFADLDLQTEDLGGQVQVTLTDASALEGLIAPLRLDGGQVSLTAGGTLTSPELMVSGELAAPSVSEFGAERLRVNGQANGFPADFDLELLAAGLVAPPPLLQALGSSLMLAAQGQASDRTVRLDSLALTTPAISIEGDGDLDLVGPSADLALALDYPDLTRLAPLAGLDLGGAWQGDTYVTLEPGGRLSALVSGAAEALVLGLPEAELLLGPQPSLWIEAQRDSEGAIQLDSLRLDGQALTATGEGRLAADGDAVDARLTLELPDLGRLSEAGIPVGGAARVDANLTGSLGAPDVSLAVAAPRLTVAGNDVTDVNLTGRSRGLPPALTGRVDASAGTAVGPVRLGGDVAVEAEQLRVSDLQVLRGGDLLRGSFTAPLAGLPARGRLDLAVADLGAYAPLLPELAGGRLDVGLDLAERGGTQAADVALRLRDLSLTDGTELAAAEVTAGIEDLLAAPSLSLRANAGGLRSGPVYVGDLAAQAEGSLADLAVAVEAAGRIEAPESQALSLQTRGRVALEETMRLDLSELSARYGELEARLLQPARLALAGDRLSAEGLRLGFNEGEVDLDAELEGRQVRARLAVRDLPLSLAEAAGLDLPLGGLLEAEANLTGPLPQPEGRLRLRTEGLRLAERVAAETLPLSFAMDGSLSAGRLQARATLSGFAEEALIAEADLPLLIDNAPLSVELPEDAPLSATARWSGRLAPVVGLLPIDVVRIEGQGDLDLVLGGTLADPQASGALTVSDGLYENFTLGTLLRPFELRAEGEGSRLVLRSFSAQDGEGGTLSASGWLDLAGPVPRFEVEAETAAATLVRRDDLTAQLNSRFSLSGDLDAAALNGSIETQRIDVSLAGELPPSVATLEVEEINTGRPAPPAADEAGPSQDLAALALDVGIDIPGRLFVRGRGLDSEWRGTFRISGTAAAPRVVGDLQPVRGFFDFAGRRFDLEQGGISFAGGPDLDPQLDLNTVYTDDGFTARIAITGPASAPVIALSSEPAFPEDEIISRILFGEGTARLSAGQALQVAQAASTLAGRGGLGVLDVARQTLGVDVLTFAPGSSDDDLGQLEAGRYFTDDVFVGVRQGATPGSSSAVVEWEVTPNLTLESEVGGTARDDSLGFSWQWDY